MGVTKEELAKLSRDELEAAVAYWEPKALAVQAENNRIKDNERLVTRMKFWRRLRWAITGK